MTTLKEIEALAKRYAEARDATRDRAEAVEAEIAAVKRRWRGPLRQLVATEAARRAELEAAIDGSRHLFEKPRSRILHGIKVGIRKAKGRLVWSDEAAVVKLIRRHLGDRAETLIKVTEKPVRAALERLPTGDLKRIGVEVEETGDEVLVKPADSEIDRMIEALLDSAEDEQEAA